MKTMLRNKNKILLAIFLKGLV